MCSFSSKYYNIAVHFITLISTLSNFESQLHARHCPTSFTYVHQCILPDDPIKYYYYPPFRDKDTEPQRHEVTCLCHTASKLQSWDLNRHHLAPESVLLATNQLFLILRKPEKGSCPHGAYVPGVGGDVVKHLATRLTGAAAHRSSREKSAALPCKGPGRSVCACPPLDPSRG